MGVFDRQIETALRLISKNGQSVQYLVVGDPIPIPDKPWETIDPPPTLHEVKICFLPLNQQDMQSFGYMGGSDIPKGAVKGLMGAVPFEISLKGYIVRNGKRLNIDKFNDLSPNGEKILYTLILKD